MTQQYDNELRGILSRNERKEKDTHPDHRGSCQIDGVEYWISAWVQTGRPGNKLAGQRYFQLRFEPKQQQPHRSPPRAASRPPAAQPYRNHVEDMSDDIPF